MSTKEDQLNFIKNHLISEILKKFPNEILLESEIKVSDGLDGFMSALYKLNLRTSVKETKKENIHSVIVKCMKGDPLFRESSKSYTQFGNEIFIYSKVLPYYEKLVEKSKLSSLIKVREWTPYVYYAKYGHIEGLSIDSSSVESVLALENINPKGYRGGPRLHLDKKHLFLMLELIAKYHSITYVMRLQKDEQLEKFINEIIPLPWAYQCENGLGNLYDVIYKIAFERFFLYYDRKKNCYAKDFIDSIEKIRKYKDNPTDLLEKIREKDEVFSVILHGDYNRNNVLFKYDNEESHDDPKDIKMIDFQELRYGTPTIDLSFFMYMNTDPAIRNDIWMELLHHYHSTLIDTLAKMLHVSIDDEILKPYSFEKFYKHFTKFGFYGAMVCMHFLPWMYCTEDECSQLSHLFDTDMHGNEFRKLSIEAGGDTCNEIIMNIAQHADRMGYISSLLE